MRTIIPLPVPEGIGRRADTAALVFALARMTPGLWAPILAGESFEDALTRREAARDILDDLLAEYAAECAEAVA